MTGRRLHVVAFGIHTGGGRALLKALLAQARPVVKSVALDERYGHAAPADAFDAETFVDVVRRSWMARARASLDAARRAQAGDVVLCFNSLPLLRRSAAYVITYVHAPHFVGLHAGVRYGWLTRLRLVIERLWFSSALRHSNECWVQTESMALGLAGQHPGTIVRIVPFVDAFIEARLGKRTTLAPPHSDWSDLKFVYPADAVGHKNHEALLRAWSLLAQRKRTPRLLLTLEESQVTALCVRAGIDRQTLRHVEASGPLPRSVVLEKLSSCSALIFPSLAETFGMPLLEATALGLPILASERDFVRDVCSPRESFEPTSPRSISRAVARFAGLDETHGLELFGVREFVSLLLARR